MDAINQVGIIFYIYCSFNYILKNSIYILFVQYSHNEEYTQYFRLFFLKKRNIIITISLTATLLKTLEFNRLISDQIAMDGLTTDNS